MKQLTIVLLIFVLVAACIVPASAYQNDERINYKVTPWYEFNGNEKSIIIPGIVMQGRTVEHNYNVLQTTSVIDASLVWSLPPQNNILSLTIKTPTGYTIGTYYDNFEGIQNGIIPVHINLPQLQPGNWKFQVDSVSAVSSQNYQLIIRES